MVLKKVVKEAQKVLDVSQSVLACWRRCHMKYNYRYVQLLERKKPMVYFVIGSMIGECLDALALQRSNPKAPKWPSVLRQYEKEYGKLFRAEQEYYGDPIGTARRIVERYELIYKEDGFTYVMGKDGKPFELTGTVELAPGIVFTFHIDKLPKDKHGRVWILDHKAYKNIPDADSRFSALQLVFYFKAVSMLPSEFPRPTGLIWDYLRKKAPAVPEVLKKGGLSQRASMDTDYETYLAAIKENKLNPKDYKEMLDSLKERGHMDFYLRVPMAAPNRTLVETIWNDAVATAKEIQAVGKTNTVRSMDRTCKSCEYYNLCQAEVRGLDSSYIRKTEYTLNKEPRHDHSQENDD